MSESQQHLNFHAQLDMLIRAQSELLGIQIMSVKCEWIDRNIIGSDNKGYLESITVESASYPRK